MGKASEPQIKDFHGKDHTCITFKPDLAKFKMDKLDKDTVSLLTRRAFDIAGSVRGLEVYLNKEKIKVHAVYLAHALSLSLRLSLSHARTHTDTGTQTQISAPLYLIVFSKNGVRQRAVWFLLNAFEAQRSCRFRYLIIRRLTFMTGISWNFVSISSGLKAF